MSYAQPPNPVDRDGKLTLRHAGRLHHIGIGHDWAGTRILMLMLMRVCGSGCGVPNPRLLITAVVVEGRSQAEVARSYGISPAWLCELVARYRAEGEAAFQPRSRRPTTSPTATPAATVDLILRLRKQLAEAGLDAGADTIAWHLQHHHGCRCRAARSGGTFAPPG